MKKQFILQTILFAFCSIVYATQPGGSNKFSVSLKGQGFIENKGQFDGAPGVDSKILFGIDNPGEQIHFTSSGITFIYALPHKEENELKVEEGKNFFGVQQCQHELGRSQCTT